MFKTYTFPSVFESNNTDLRNVSPDLINGLKVTHNGEGYVLGNLALTEGVSPHRNINAAPDELDYSLLLKSGLLIANQKLGNPLTITTGFPFSTFQLYKETATNLINQFRGHHGVGTFSGQQQLAQLLADYRRPSTAPEPAYKPPASTGQQRLLFVMPWFGAETSGHVRT